MIVMKKWVIKFVKRKCKIPYQIVVGDKEVENNEVNVRQYGSQDQETLEKDEFIWNLVDEIRLKNIDNLEKDRSYHVYYR